MTLPPPSTIGAQVAAKAGVARRRPQARGDDARARRRRAPSQRGEARCARRVGPGDGRSRRGRRDSRAQASGRSRCERASLVDNRFYKSHAASAPVSPRPLAALTHPRSHRHESALPPVACARSARCSHVAAVVRCQPALGAAASAAWRRRARRRRARPASSCAAPTSLQPPPRGDAAQAAADHPAGARGARPARPRCRGRRRRRVPARRGRHPRRPAELRPGRGPGARHRQRRHQPRRQRLQRPRAAAQGRALRRLLSHPDLSLRAHRRRRQGRADRVHRRPARRRQRRHLLELQPRGRPGPGLDPEGRASMRHRQRDQQGIARDAVLRFYGVPILASPVLSFPLNDERKSGLLPPSFGLDSRSGFQVGDALLLEHRAQSRRDLHAASRARAAARRSTAEFRYLEPRYFGRGRRSGCCRTTAPATAIALCVPLPMHEGAPARATCYAQAARAARLRRRLLEGLPGRRRSSLTPRLLQTDLLADAGRSATGRPTRGCSAGRCCRPPTRRRGSIAAVRAAPQVGARYAAPWRGGFDVGFEAEFNRFANPDDHYLDAAPDRRPRARARQHQPGRSTRRAGR